MLKDRIQKRFNLPEDCFDSHCTDLYVLYTPELWDWLRVNYNWACNMTLERSNVAGQAWYGKHFIDIPFSV